MNFFKRLIKKKTFWAAVAAIVTSCGAYFMGEISGAVFYNAVITSLIGVFLRDGMAKAEDKK